MVGCPVGSNRALISPRVPIFRNVYRGDYRPLFKTADFFFWWGVQWDRTILNALRFALGIEQGNFIII